MENPVEIYIDSLEWHAVNNAIYIYCFWLDASLVCMCVSFTVLMNLISFDKLFQTDWLWCQLITSTLFLLSIDYFFSLWFRFSFFFQFLFELWWFNYHVAFTAHSHTTNTQPHKNNFIQMNRLAHVHNHKATMVIGNSIIDISFESTTNFSRSPHN